MKQEVENQVKREERYEFSIGQRVEFVTGARTLRGRVTDRSTTTHNTAVYQIAAEIKVAWQDVLVHDVCERDIRGNLIQQPWTDRWGLEHAIGEGS